MSTYLMNSGIYYPVRIHKDTENHLTILSSYQCYIALKLEQVIFLEEVFTEERTSEKYLQRGMEIQ